MPLRDRPVPADHHPTSLQVEEGQRAPDFTLPSTDGGKTTLSDLRGQWVVLYFYPEDHTPGCTMEGRRFRAYFEAISLQQAAVVGVSRDNQENHCDFRDRNALPFHLLSDEDGAVHDMYGAWRKPWLGRSRVHARRCTFLVDSRGVVRKTYPKVKPMSHAQQVVRDLERLSREVRRERATGPEAPS